MQLGSEFLQLYHSVWSVQHVGLCLISWGPGRFQNTQTTVDALHKLLARAKCEVGGSQHTPTPPPPAPTTTPQPTEETQWTTWRHITEDDTLQKCTCYYATFRRTKLPWYLHFSYFSSVIPLKPPQSTIIMEVRSTLLVLLGPPQIEPSTGPAHAEHTPSPRIPRPWAGSRYHILNPLLVHVSISHHGIPWSNPHRFRLWVRNRGPSFTVFVI
jgi:hypothetical protein